MRDSQRQLIMRLLNRRAGNRSWLLVIGTRIFWRIARASMGLSIPPTFDNGLLTGVFIIEVGVQTGLDGHWPIEPHTGLWWNFIAVALVVTVNGAIRRHIAETHLEELDG